MSLHSQVSVFLTEIQVWILKLVLKPRLLLLVLRPISGFNRHAEEVEIGPGSPDVLLDFFV